MAGRGLRLALAAALVLGAGPARAADPAGVATGGIWGTVRQNGSAVAGARVSVHRTGPPYRLHDARRAFDGLEVPELDAAPAVMSDATGTFAVPDLVPGTYVVEANVPKGSACGLSASLSVEPSAWTPVAVSMVPFHAIEGRVFEADESPFLGVLALARDIGYDANTPRHACRRARTDEHGAFRVDRVPLGRWRAFALRPGRDGVALETLDLDGTRAPALRLPVASPRTVRVVDAEGRPVVGARVASVPFGDKSGGFSGGVTGADGAVLLSRAGTAAALVTVDAAGYVPWQESIAKGSEEVRIVATRGQLAGRVVGRVEGEDGTPVEGVAVGVFEGDESFLVPYGDPVTSGPDGRFAMNGVEAGPAWIAALGAGFAGARLSAPSEPPRGAELFTVPAGGEVVRTVRVRRAASIEGVVVDEDRRPIPGALVRWHTDSLETVEHGTESAPPGEARVASAADGSFRIRSIAAGVTATVSASAPGFFPGDDRVDVGKPGSVARGVRVVLRRARFVAVRVFLGREPAVGADVRVSYESGGFPTGLDGRAILGPLPRTRLEVSASHRDSPSKFEVALPAGGDVAVDADLTPGLAIEGRVVDAAGKGVARAVVTAEPQVPGKPSRLGESWVIAEEDGTFRIRGLAAGTWQLTVGPSGSGTPLDVLAGTRDVTLRFTGDEAGASNHLRVRVVGPDGKPVPRATVRWISAHERTGAPVVDGVASVAILSLEEVAGGTVEVRGARDARDEPLPLGPSRVGPLARGVREVEVRLPQGRGIAGRVTGPTGAPVEGVEVVAVRTPVGVGKNDEPDVLASAKSAADGAFVLYGVGDAEEVLLAVRPRGPAEELGLATWVPVRAGATGVSVPLVAHVTALVTVLEESGAAAGGVMVRADRIYDLGGRDRAKARTTDVGRARLEGLVPGAVYRLVVTRGREDERPIAEREAWTPADTLVRLTPPVFVRGVVRDREGRPAEGAFVVATVNGEWVGFGGSDAEGAFAVQVPADGAVDLQALPSYDPWSSGFVERELASPVAKGVAAGAPATLIVGRGVHTSVRVAGEEAPGAWADVRAWLTREKEPWDAEADTGQIQIDGGGGTKLPPLVGGARYRLWLPAGRTGRCALLSFTAREGLGIDVRPVPAGSVRGRVHVPDGATRRIVAVEGRGFSLREPAAADGTFEVAGVPVGEPFEVVATARVDGVEWTARVAARAGVEVELVPAAPR